MPKQDASRKYSPLWVLLFSTSATLLKVVGERYLLQRQWKLSRKDAMTALGGAVLGYVTFRYRYGNKKEGALTR